MNGCVVLTGGGNGHAPAGPGHLHQGILRRAPGRRERVLYTSGTRCDANKTSSLLGGCFESALDVLDLQMISCHPVHPSARTNLGINEDPIPESPNNETS